MTRAAAMLIVGVLAGCSRTPSEPVDGSRGAVVAHPAQPATGDPIMPPAVATLVGTRCTWCHAHTPPPGGVQLLPGGTTFPAQHLVATLDAIDRGLAPFADHLSGAERVMFRQWLQGNGAPVQHVAAARPYRVRWSSTQLGTTLPGIAYVIEDGYIDSAAWSVVSVGDGVGIRVQQAHRPGGTQNPSSYWSPPLPFHPWHYNTRIRLRMQTGRWSGPALMVRTLHPTGRTHREYVWLSVDRDAYALVSTPTPLETRPPNIADCCLVGTTYVQTPYLTSSVWVDVDFSATRVAGGTRYVAVVRRSDTGHTVTLDATSARDAMATGGFVLRTYGANGSPTLYTDIEYEALVEGGTVPRHPPHEPPTWGAQ